MWQDVALLHDGMVSSFASIAGAQLWSGVPQACVSSSMTQLLSHASGIPHQSICAGHRYLQPYSQLANGNEGVILSFAAVAGAQLWSGVSQACVRSSMEQLLSQAHVAPLTKAYVPVITT